MVVESQREPSSIGSLIARSVPTGVRNGRDEWTDTSEDSRGRSGRISGDDVPLTTTLSVAGGDERANTLITWAREDSVEPGFWFCSSCKGKNFLFGRRRDGRGSKNGMLVSMLARGL